MFLERRDQLASEIEDVALRLEPWPGLELRRIRDRLVVELDRAERSPAP